MAYRPCLDCGGATKKARCADCERSRDRQLWASGKGDRYDTAWRRHSRRTIADHIAAVGPVCPGWSVGAHVVEPSAFVCDHDVGPLCRSCNSRKAATFDKEVR
jgi:hypothetical protein